VDNRLERLINPEVLAEEARKLMAERDKDYVGMIEAYKHGESPELGKEVLDRIEYVDSNPDTYLKQLPLYLDAFASAVFQIMARNNREILEILGGPDK